MPGPIPIPLPLTSAPGQRPQESAGRLVNCYAEPLGKGARWTAVRRRVPGLSAFGTSAGTGFRGMIPTSSVIYAGWQGIVYSFPSTGVGTRLTGSLPGSAKVFWAKNNKTPTPDVVAVSPGDGAFVVSSTAVSAYPDSKVGQPNGVAFLFGFFFFTYGNQQILASALNGTAINPLDLATAEAKSDTLLRPIAYGGALYACGTDSIEVWGAPVNDTGFPLNRVTVIQPGLASASAIAGHEDGFGKGVIYVGSDNAVNMLNGYTPQKISPPDLDRLIESVSDKSTLEASVHTANGHAFWTLSCTDWTWEFDLNNSTWHERESVGTNSLPGRWRGTQTCSAFGKWLCGDTQTGNIVTIDPAARDEVGTPLRVRVESGPVHQFPIRVPVARIDVDISTGVGIATGDQFTQVDPHIEVSICLDGQNWGIPRLIKLGAQAVVKQRVHASRFGLSTERGARVRFDISDPVDVGLMGATMYAPETDR